MHLSNTVKDLYKTLAHSGRLQIHIQGVHPDTSHFLVPLLRAGSGRNVLVVVPDMERARRLYEELRCLLSGGRRFAGVHLLPVTCVSPYIEISVDTRRQQELLGTLSRVASGREIQVLVVPVVNLCQAWPVPETLGARTKTLVPGQEIGREAFLQQLVDSGYVRVTTVLETGSFAVRGSLLDIYSPGEQWPVRIDFFGDEVESISTFHPDTQVTTGKVTAACIAPATPVLDTACVLARARPRLLALADEQRCPSSVLGELLDSLRAGELPTGAQALMPILLEKTAALTQYLPPDKWIVLLDDMASILQAVARLHENESARYEAYRNRGRLALPPARLFLDSNGILDLLHPYTRVNSALLDEKAQYRFDLGLSPPVPGSSTGAARLEQTAQRVAKCHKMGFRMLLTAPDLDEARKAAGLFSGSGVHLKAPDSELTQRSLLATRNFDGMELFLSQLTRGVYCPDLGLLVLTTAELLERKRKASGDSALTSMHKEALFELEEGDHVVHREYGIGRFVGVERKVMGAGEYTCLKIAYAKGDTLYVPVHNAGIIQRYIGSGQAAPKLDQLGSSSWAAKVKKARSATKKLAVDLLNLYATRQTAHGFPFSPSDEYFAEFESAFPYDETPDQARSVEEVLCDMEKPRPMDRLVCGDVGFGKTEVAVRAAFKSVLDGKQVAVLVPTTVLAEQHRITFESRFGAYPVTVESLSRFKTKALQRATLTRLAEGRVDVIIGTHRLLSEDVAFKNLGLLIVDEEHRFGVGHKEKLKSYRSTVDVLSMTATPIPRTLHMAMSGIRDLSVIKTPPPGRLDIETYLIHFDPEAVRDAIEREVGRGGQVFFLHNRVEDILTVREQLEGLIPGLRVGVGHGQMRESALEKAMVDFMRRKYDVLLCTTIIESGLDMPNVNTLIVNNAHNFGLGQLYQIRGRVGRSERQAYAYFIVPPTETMSIDARSRLATLTRFTAVGSGFQVASIDMELRGAGDLLGPHQSGYIAAVGFDMYIHLLHEEVDKLKSSQAVPTTVECQVELSLDAHIPEDFVQDRHQRLVLYRMAASAQTPEDVDRIRFEIRDRFGALPEPVARLLSIAEIRVRATALGIRKVTVKGATVTLDVSEAPDRVLAGMVELVKSQPVPLRVTPDHKVVGDLDKKGAPDPVARAKRLLNYVERAVGTGE